MRKIMKVWGMMLCIFALACFCNSVSKAAGTGSVSLTNPSGTVGSTVTVSGTISATHPFSAAYIVLNYDPARLTYTSGSNVSDHTTGVVKVFPDLINNPSKSYSFSVSFQILKEGSHAVSFGEAYVVSDEDMAQVSLGKSGGTITGTTSNSDDNTDQGGGSAPGDNTGDQTNGDTGTTTNPQDKRDSNNKLKSLKIYPGTLTPAFSAGNTTYSVKVEKDTKEVKISATPQSDKAKVTISGGKDLKPGANTAKVVVVAENGSSIAYVITIMCGEETPITIGGVEYKINENFTDAQIPSGFSRTKISHNGKQYEGLTNGNNTLKLVSLQAAESAQFYVYNEETQEFYPFIQIAIAEGKFIIPLPLNGKVEKYKNAEIISINYQDKSFDAWKLDDEFSIVYAINQDGEEVFYRYDSVDGIFQRQTDLELDLEETVKKEKKQLFPNQYYMYAIAGLGALSFILFVSMIYFIASRKHRHEARKKKAQRKLEKQKIKEEKRRLREEKKEQKLRRKEEKRRM